LDMTLRLPGKHFEVYTNEHCTRWTFNRRHLQSIISSFCVVDIIVVRFVCGDAEEAVSLVLFICFLPTLLSMILLLIVLLVITVFDMYHSRSSHTT
jgi:hypothetical protein